MKKKHILGTIQVSRKCNQNCIFCSSPHDEIDLSIEDIHSRMLELKKSGATEVMLTGGEPTLRDDLPELIRLAHSEGFNEVSIQTNGSNLHDEKKFRGYLNSGYFKFAISFHSFEKETFEKLAGGNASFENFIKFLDNVKKYKIPAYFITVINSLNYKKLKEQIKFAEKNYPNIHHFSFNFVDPAENAWKNRWIVPKLSEAESYMNEAFEYILSKGMSFRIEFVPLCFLQGYIEYSSELRREAFKEPSYSVFLRKEDLENKEVLKRGDQYFKAPQCKECALEKKCAGVNARYVRVHGFDELVPVKENKNTDAHAIIQIENRCNQSCVFCSVDCSAKTDLSLDETKKKINFFMKRGVTQLTLSGGEPTLNPDLFNILLYAKKKGIKKITIQTNGVLLSNRQFLEKIIACFPVDFMISFHASDRETYSKITGVKKDYELALKGISNVNNLSYGNHGIGIVISSVNYKKLKDHVKFIHENFSNMTFFNIIFIDPVNKAKENFWTVAKMSDIEPYLYSALGYIRRHGLNAVVDRLPLCYLRDYEEYSASSRSIINDSPNLYFLINRDEYEYSNARHNFNKDCDLCRLKKICGGLPQNYIDLVGDSERYPVFDDLGRTVQKIKNRMSFEAAPQKKKTIEMMNKENFSEFISHSRKDLGIIINSSMDTNPKLSKNNPKYNGLRNHEVEWAGLETGIKKGSVFYVKPHEIRDFFGYAKKKGYFCDTNDYGFSIDDSERIQIVPKSKSYTLPVFVSRSEDTVESLKRLDKEEKFGGNLSISNELGKILGYPKCCIEFNYKMQKKKKHPNPETDMRLISLKATKGKPHYLLNNFHGSAGTLIPFFPCSYECKHAISFAEKILDQLQKKDSEKIDGFISYLKLPMLFFRYFRDIAFENLSEHASSERFLMYGGVIFSLNPDYPAGSTRLQLLFDLDIVQKFRQGDSFRLTDNLIEIDKNGKRIAEINSMRKENYHLIRFKQND